MKSFPIRLLRVTGLLLALITMFGGAYALFSDEPVSPLVEIASWAMLVPLAAVFWIDRKKGLES